MHPDFGTVDNGAPNGIPVTVVSDRVPREQVRLGYASQSDHARYPLPRGVGIEGGGRRQGDRHVIVVQRSTCTDYELFAAHPRRGYWTAGSGAIIALGSDRLRAAGWTSADAAGLPPMGLRVRLKSGLGISRLPRQARIVALALKRYGMILADNGSPGSPPGATSKCSTSGRCLTRA